MTNILLTSYNRLSSTVGLHGCAICFRKKAWREIDGIQRVPAQDFDAALRLIENDWKIICEMRARSITIAPSFKPWIKQRFRWMGGFSFALFNHFRVFITKPFGLFFLVLYNLLGLVYVLHFLINSGFFGSVISLVFAFISFHVPVFAAVGIFIGFFGWALYARIILIVLYSLLSLPYVTYPYDLKGFLRAPLVFAFSFIYLPLFVLTGAVGVVLAIGDKIAGRKVVNW